MVISGMDIYMSTSQREALIKLVEALGSWDRALRRDECGDPSVKGKYGRIHAVPGMLSRKGAAGFQIYFRGADEDGEPTSTQAWTWAKKMLAFCEVTNDGDGEGMLFLDRLPTAAEAEVIRDKLGIRKRMEFDEETLARKREQALKARESSRQKPALEDSAMGRTRVWGPDERFFGYYGPCPTRLQPPHGEP
jgi:hypothetical protein